MWVWRLYKLAPLLMINMISSTGIMWDVSGECWNVAANMPEFLKAHKYGRWNWVTDSVSTPALWSLVSTCSPYTHAHTKKHKLHRSKSCKKSIANPLYCAWIIVAACFSSSMGGFGELTVPLCVDICDSGRELVAGWSARYLWRCLKPLEIMLCMGVYTCLLSLFIISSLWKYLCTLITTIRTGAKRKHVHD
jgi:hypothetical protein